MLNTQPLDHLPIWGVYLLTVFVLYMSIEAGFRFGLSAQKRRPDHAETGVGAMVGASMAFLGFMLAFIVGIAINIYNERRALVVDEANAIGTSYLRAEYLDEPFSTESRQLLREYVDMRLAALDRSKLATSIIRSEEIHQELWNQGVILAKNNPTPTTALFLSSLNEVIDLHSKRVNAQLEVRVPPAILLGLYLVAMLSMVLIGMHDSYSGNRSFIALFVMVLILSLVFILITDLERSSQGFMQVSQEPLIVLQQQLSLGP